MTSPRRGGCWVLNGEKRFIGNAGLSHLYVVFDLAFCINHLLLKCVWHPQYTEQYLASFRALMPIRSSAIA